jgi:hypothetical protein
MATTSAVSSKSENITVFSGANQDFPETNDKL